MTDTPELDEFVRALRRLRARKPLKACIQRGRVELGRLTLEQVAEQMLFEPARYFLMAAANLNRTSLKKAAQAPEAIIVEKKLRVAYAVRARLPRVASFEEVAVKAEALRRGDLGRKARGGIEALFRARLQAERIPVVMAPPNREVPGLLVAKRKPDGVWPDPATGEAPRLYLEIKNLRRVSDDIQKRLYEIAEAAIEMKLLYGGLELRGLAIPTIRQVIEGRDELRAALRARIATARPVVVALFLCPRAEAEKYRPGAEAFIDRLFFQEEVDDCIAFLREATRTTAGAPPA
ncbi:MAG TPA: hypothetical protein VHE35_29535 [Kofleriaceae bacterium]|nr:hypothetical protein [Kofleriaceae bacterium]